LRWLCNSFLASVYVLYCVFQFAYIESSLHSWNKANLSMVYDLFNVVLNLPCKYFIEDFCICLSRNGVQFSFFVVSLPTFCIRVIWASWNQFGNVASICILWNSLRSTGISYLKVW
jgi:hypothetical protein